MPSQLLYERLRINWFGNSFAYEYLISTYFFPSFISFLDIFMYKINIIDDKDWPPRSSVIYGGGSASLTSHQAIYSSLSPLLHFTQLTSTIVVSLLFSQLSQLIWYRWWFVSHELCVHSKKTSKTKNNVISKSYLNNYNRNNYNNNNHHDNNDDYLVVKILLDKFPHNNELLLYHHRHHQYLKISKLTNAALILCSSGNNYHVSRIICTMNKKEAAQIVIVTLTIMEQIKDGNRKSWQQRQQTREW